MDDENIDTYEEIRGTASKNWMRGASVSLQHLDQVKATKYNLGLADPNSLKAVGKNAAIYKAQSDCNAEVDNIETAPPVASVTSQQNAWGSNASIPDLIKHQTDRLKLPKPVYRKPSRPESAKVKKQTRPPSGKRVRPQSAKEQMYKHNSEEVNAEPRFCIGARLSTPQTADLDSLLDGAPPPPRGSPDFMHMMESENGAFRESDMEGVVNDLIDAGSQHASPRLQISPRRPTPEPIHFALPNADEDYDSDNDNQSNLKDLVFEQPEKENVEFDRPDVAPKKEFEPRKVEIRLVDGYQNEPETLIGQDDSGPHLRKEFTINEDENETFDITPRERKPRPQSGKHPSRPESGKNNLRYVKSRTDSGMDSVRLNTPDQSIEQRSEYRPLSGKKQPISTITVNFLEESDGEDDKKTTKVRSKPGKPDVTGMVAGLTLSDTEGADTDAEDLDHPGSRPGSPTKNVSRLPLNYYEFGMSVKPGKGVFHRQEQKPVAITTKTLALLGDDERTVQEFKTVSVLDQNKISKPKEYVAPRPPSAKKPKPKEEELAKQNKTPKSADDVETQMEKGKNARAEELKVDEKGEPVKTGDIPDNINRKPGTIPNPAARGFTYGIRNRPRSAVNKTGSRPTSAVNKPPPSQNSRPRSAAPSRMGDIETAVNFVDKLEQAESAGYRPGSRVGFNEENLDSREGESLNPGILKMRRVGSAPSSRLQGAAAHANQPRFNLIRNRPLSAQSANNRKPEYSGCNHNRNHEVGKPVHDHNHNRNYPRYPNRSAMSRKGKAAPDKVIEIWTRRDDFTMETEGVKECKRMQDKLIDAGVPVTLEALTRGLLPPTEYGFSKPSITTDMNPTLPPNYSSGLISKPELWLVDEYKRLKLAEKKVRQATAQLLAQERAERKRAESAVSSSTVKKKKTKGKRKGKGKKLRESKSAQSLGSQG